MLTTCLSSRCSSARVILDLRSLSSSICEAFLRACCAWIGKAVALPTTCETCTLIHTWLFTTTGAR